MNNSANENQSADAGLQYADDEISLLDLLQVIVDNLRLLLLWRQELGLGCVGGRNGETIAQRSQAAHQGP